MSPLPARAAARIAAGQARVLAIDPGLTTGWARSGGATGSIDLRHDGDFAAGLAAWQQWLANTISDDRPDVLVVERALFAGRFRNADFTPAVSYASLALAHQHMLKRAEIFAVDVRRALWPEQVKKPADRQRVLIARGNGFDALDNHAADAALLLLAWQAKQ